MRDPSSRPVSACKFSLLKFTLRGYYFQTYKKIEISSKKYIKKLKQKIESCKFDSFQARVNSINTAQLDQLANDKNQMYKKIYYEWYTDKNLTEVPDIS